MLDGLGREPEVVDANLGVASGLPESRRQHPERLGRLDRDPQLGLAAQTAQQGRGALLLGTGRQQIDPETNLRDVHRRR